LTAFSEVPKKTLIRGFLDFERLYRFHKAGSFFVTRGKSNLKIQRRYSHPVDRKTGLICDQSVVLTGFYSHEGFEAPLRRIRFKDPETAKTLYQRPNSTRYGQPVGSVRVTLGHY
jgi:hypothetical protein